MKTCKIQKCQKHTHCLCSLLICFSLWFMSYNQRITSINSIWMFPKSILIGLLPLFSPSVLGVPYSYFWKKNTQDLEENNLPRKIGHENHGVAPGGFVGCCFAGWVALAMCTRIRLRPILGGEFVKDPGRRIDPWDE